eukprot:TRINITY_DN7929_c1_g2_i1.p1 TRINITY_DN7929_c1_g2~~TRINITY_DN7929_c1_g2_i1.p1  ORF type:complete len:565 (+),score=112.30 TRINITY_DN7929_c1_g2_i1:74-1768(+)
MPQASLVNVFLLWLAGATCVDGFVSLKLTKRRSALGISGVDDTHVNTFDGNAATTVQAKQSGPKPQVALAETSANSEWGLLTDAAKHMKDAVKDAVTDATESVVKELGKEALGDRAVDSLELKGESKGEINSKVIVCTACVVAAAVIGLLADRWTSRERENKAPSWLVLAILAASYALLLPGLFAELFSFLIGIEMLGLKILVSSEDGKPAEITESTVSVLGLLFKTGGTVGALLVILYAMVVPFLKLVALSLAEMWRHSKDPSKVRTASRLIGFVQIISKWACPDMFAYILLIYLFRHLDGGGEGMVHSPSQLGVGFACFTIFCVGSTFASLAVEPPDTDSEEDADDSPPFALRVFSLERLTPAVLLLALTFAGLFVAGLSRPCMGLRLNEDILVGDSSDGKILPESYRPMIEKLHLEDMINADVSMIRATKALIDYLSHGELTNLFAVVMLVVFVMVFPVLDLIALLWATFQITAKVPQSEAAERAMAIARWFKHGCMLDVAVMGVIVVTFAGAAYKKQGVIILCLPGLWLLLAAEVVHYVLYYAVHGAVNWQAKKALQHAP